MAAGGLAALHGSAPTSCIAFWSFSCSCGAPLGCWLLAGVLCLARPGAGFAKSLRLGVSRPLCCGPALLRRRAWPLAGLRSAHRIAGRHSKLQHTPSWLANLTIALCALIFAAFLLLQIQLALNSLDRLRVLGLVPWSYANFRWVFALAVAPLFIVALLSGFRLCCRRSAGLLIVLSGATCGSAFLMAKIHYDGRRRLEIVRPALVGPGCGVDLVPAPIPVLPLASAGIRPALLQTDRANLGRPPSCDAGCGSAIALAPERAGADLRTD